MAIELENGNIFSLLFKHHHSGLSDKQCSSYEDVIEELGPDVQSWSVQFVNQVHPIDVKFLMHKFRQLKKQKIRKILNGCVKILRHDENYIWAYIIAGAACRKYEKRTHDSFFYFSQAALLNPNCLSAWIGLSKYIKDNPFVEDIVFQTVFSALLQIEKRLEARCEIVKDIIYLSDFVPERKPLGMLSPIIFSSDNSLNMEAFQSISEYIFANITQAHKISDVLLGNQILGVCYRFNTDLFFLKKIFLYTFHNGFYQQFTQFCKLFFCSTSIEDLACDSKFVKKLILLLSWSGNLISNVAIQKVAVNFPEKLSIRPKHHIRYFSTINVSFGDFRRARDNHLKLKSKALQQKIEDKLVGLQSYFNLGCYKSVWDELLLCNYSWRKKLLRMKSSKKLALYSAYRGLWLSILTRGSTKPMIKMGTLFCLKLINMKITSILLLFNACIGCIGLGEIDIIFKLFRRLLRLGALNEVLFLKYLMEEDISYKNTILKELNEFSIAHEVSTVTSSKSEKESRAFKTICKASVMVPQNSTLYEWLGIYFYERGHYEKAEKYFEIALFYNPSSWVAINYFSTLLAKKDTEASKLFLDLYRSQPAKKYDCSHLVAFKAGLYFLKYHSQKYDFYKACENLRFGIRCTYKNRHFQEMLGESYSLYGMVGVGAQWLSECFIVDNKFNIYAGSQLGRLYLFKSGVEKYTRTMRRVLSHGGQNTFISVHNAAHSFHLKALLTFNKTRPHLSQIYNQKALFMAVRALSISSNYPATWKILGDIFCLCGFSCYKTGFLYIPHWLLPGVSSKKILLIRRFQALKLSIRCYYAALSLPFCSSEMKASLWTSLSFSYRQINKLCKRSQSNQILLHGVYSSFEALDENVKDCLSWNTLGVLIKDLGKTAPCISDVYLHASLSFANSEKLSKIVQYKLISASNNGFLSLWAGDFEKAYNVFLTARGQCTSLDFPWIGQIFLNLLSKHDILNTLNIILFLYKLTHHRPKMRGLFSLMLLLSHYMKKSTVIKICHKYSNCCGNGIFNFKEYLLSSYLHLEKKMPEMAKLDLIFALRTCCGLKQNGINDFNTALFELSILQTDPRLQVLFSSLISHGLIDSYDDRLKDFNISYLKNLNSGKNIYNRNVSYLALSLKSYELGRIEKAKYYFSKA